MTLIFISVVPCAAQSPFSKASHIDINTDYLFLQSLFPHSEGSENEKSVIRFIEDRLRLLDIPFLTRDFSHMRTGHSFSRIIEATMKGESEEILMIAVPLNHPLDATKATDGSFGIALGLNLIEHFRANPPFLTVQVVFLGGEFAPGENQFLGTSAYLDSAYPVERLAILYLMLESFPARLRIMSGGRGIVSPLWMLKKTMEALAASRLPWTIQENRQQIFRTGLVTAATQVETYLRRGYPAIGIRTTGVSEPSPSDAELANSLRDSLIGFVQSLSGGLPETWDTHYVFLPVLFHTVLVPETEYVVILLLISLIVISFAAFRLTKIKKYYRTIRRNFWNIPLFFLASFLILLGVTALLESLLAVRNIPTLWTHLPVVFLLLKISLFLFAGALIFRLGRRLPFSKNGSFYTAAALFFILLCIVVIAFINISFIYYFLWSLFFIFLFSIFRSKRLKVLFFLLSPVAVIAILLDLFLLPELKFCDIILFNKISGNLLFTVIIIPFVLLLIRIRLFFPYRRASFFSSKSLLFMSAALALAVFLGTIVLLYRPYQEPNSQPVRAEYLIDNDENTRSLSLSSPAPLGSIEIVDQAGIHPLKTASRSYLMPLSDKPEDFFTATLSHTEFAGRSNVDVLLHFKDTPFQVSAELFSSSAFRLDDSNFPARAEGENRYEFSIGINPPATLPLELTLPSGHTYTLTVTVRYQNGLPGVQLYGSHVFFERRIIFKKSITFSL